MLRRTHLIAALLLTVSLTSCYESQVPLSEPNPATTDESIKGVWHAVIEKNDVYLHIIPMRPPLLKLIRVTHVNVGGFYNLDELEMFPTVIEGRRYMNLKYLMPKDAEDEKGELEQRFTFLKYDLSREGVLTVWGLDYEAWKKAIAAKRIKGTAWETTWGSNVRLDDTGKNILNYLSAKDTDREFRIVGQFRRIKVADAPRLR